MTVIKTAFSAVLSKALYDPLPPGKRALLDRAIRAAHALGPVYRVPHVDPGIASNVASNGEIPSAPSPEQDHQATRGVALAVDAIDGGG